MKIKNLILVTLMIIPLDLLFGQAPPDFSSVCREQMKKLSYLVGNWKGEATYKHGSAPAQTITQEERIEFRLNDTVLQIEGIGRNTDTNEIVFNALGIINYDPFRKEFSFRAYLKEGRSTDAYFKILDEAKFEWGFNVPNGKIRYTMTLNPEEKSWNETGEFSADGGTWMKFIEMNLKKL